MYTVCILRTGPLIGPKSVSVLFLRRTIARSAGLPVIKLPNSNRAVGGTSDDSLVIEIDRIDLKQV